MKILSESDISHVSGGKDVAPTKNPDGTYSCPTGTYPAQLPDGTITCTKPN